MNFFIIKNKKKIIIISSIIITVILLIIGIKIFTNSKKPTTGKNEGNFKIFYSSDNTAKVSIPKNYNLRQYSTYTNYILELRNEDGLNVFVSKLDNIENNSLEKIAKSDKNTYIKEFSAISNLSDLKEISINGNTAETYSFHYLDSNQRIAFYLQIVFMQIENDIYVFDFDFPLDNLNSYSNFITEFLSNFSIEE